MSRDEMKEMKEMKEVKEGLNAIYKDTKTGKIEFYAYSIPDDIPVNMSPTFYRSNL